jgi:gamma-glutamyl-gamma-aminobutyrate hydrolase PuuD
MKSVAVTQRVVDLAEPRDLPVLGVCRGMQVIQHSFRSRLEKVNGHVARRILGVMWHPERWDPFDGADIALFPRFFEA